jgi:hypothetical protein
MGLLFLSTLFLGTAVALLPAAEDASLTGQWKIHRVANGNESEQTCTVTQSGNDLAGTCRSEQGEVKMIGKVDGKQVSWTYKADRDGTVVTVVHRGQLDSATKITGTLTAVEFGVDGNFVATLSK